MFDIRLRKSYAINHTTINYYIVYEDDTLTKYKVYKLNMIGENDKYNIKVWRKNNK